MPQNLQEKLGIWGNKNCFKCGACCYEYNGYHLCRYQEIVDGKSSCKVHNKPERDRLCQTWFCSELETGEPVHEFMEIAKQLGTAPNF